MRRPALAVALALAVAGCGGSPSQTPSPSAVPPSPSAGRPTASPVPSPSAALVVFPTEAFAGIRDDPVASDLATELQSILDGFTDDAGISATVMSPRGTWSGATGSADGVRDVTVTDQFSIASTTKAVTAAQVMQLVEAGTLDLDDPAADHLPADLEFDTNGARIRDLLGHRSGIPDYVPLVPELLSDPLRVWTPAELLARIPADRDPVGEEFQYANTNYLLLGLVVEKVTGRPMARVLRDGVLAIDGVERLIYQPDEVPTEPIAVDGGRSTAYLESRGGFLPSLALTSDGAAAAMASDSVSLARWWRALCAGEIITQASLTAMLSTGDWYGLGLAEFDPPGTIGHHGEDPDGVSLAGCMPARRAVFVVLANRDGSVVHTGLPERLTYAIAG